MICPSIYLVPSLSVLNIIGYFVDIPVFIVLQIFSFFNAFINIHDYANYEGDPRSNANTSVISFTFGIIKNGLPVYYDILSIL